MEIQKFSLKAKFHHSLFFRDFSFQLQNYRCIDRKYNLINRVSLQQNSI